MTWSKRSMNATTVVAVFALYFPVAIYLKYSYVPVPARSDARIGLVGPFARFGSSGVAYVASVPFDELADSADNAERSPVILYENGIPLGPAHSLHADIAKIGHGRFSHWRGIGIVFSASDNSNPNVNWKHYSILRP